MMLRQRTLIGLLIFASACGSSTGPSQPTRVTETFSASPTLNPDGGTTYGSTANFPSVAIHAGGAVDVSVQFTPTAACQFILCVCRTDGNCGTCDLKAGPGPGPTMTTQGTLSAASYYLLMAGRSGGQSLCGDSVPTGGVPFPYTVTVTHP